MDKIASFGLTAYWDINKGDARSKMQKDIENKYQFFKSLNEINALAGDNQEFVNNINLLAFYRHIKKANLRSEEIIYYIDYLKKIK